LMLDADIPKGKIVYYESPDFLYFISKKKAIGIEITRLTFYTQYLSSEYGRKEGADKYIMRLKALIAKKKSLIPLYRQNPRITTLWLLIVSDISVYELIHRLLPELQLHDEADAFSRIEVYFPEKNSAFRL